MVLMNLNNLGDNNVDICELIVINKRCIFVSLNNISEQANLFLYNALFRVIFRAKKLHVHSWLSVYDAQIISFECRGRGFERVS